MDPCTAVVIHTMEEDLDLVSLADFSFDLISEILESIKNQTNMGRVMELHKDLFDVKKVIEETYEKKYGKKIVWKKKDSL
jgi:hypothetical protein